MIVFVKALRQVVSGESETGFSDCGAIIVCFLAALRQVEVLYTLQKVEKSVGELIFADDCYTDVCCTANPQTFLERVIEAWSLSMTEQLS